MRNTWATTTRPTGTPSNSARPAGEVARPPHSPLSTPCGKLCGKLRTPPRTRCNTGQEKVAPRASPRGRFDNLIAVALAPVGRAPLAAPLCWAPSAAAPGALAPAGLFNWGEGARLRSGVPPPAGGGCRTTPRALAPQAARTSWCVAGACGASAVGPPWGRRGVLLFWLKYVVLLCEKCIYSLWRRGMKFFQVFVAFTVKYDILTMYRSVRKFAAPVHGFLQGGHPTIAVFTT